VLGCRVSGLSQRISHVKSISPKPFNPHFATTQNKTKQNKTKLNKTNQQSRDKFFEFLEQDRPHSDKNNTQTNFDRQSQQ